MRSARVPGGMKDPRHIKPSLDHSEAPDPDTPPEEEVTRADAEQRTDLEPDEQLNRPQQPDYDPAEGEQL